MTPQPQELIPRPKLLVDLFKGKKTEIETKLLTIDDRNNSDSVAVVKQYDKELPKDWIKCMKTKLVERSTSPKQPEKPPIKLPAKSPFGEPPTTIKGDKVRNGPKTPVKVCVRCQQQVATFDRILLSGVLLHRGCLTCQRCGVTLRLSEVRRTATPPLLPNKSSDDDPQNEPILTFLCIICSKNNVTNKQLFDRSVSLDSTSTEKDSTSDTTDAVPLSSDSYESRLKERMKWKEQFLLNNNNVDFGPLISKTIGNEGEITPTNEIKAIPSVPSPALSPENKITERIEYENTSVSLELFDDDELTKLLNLESEWKSGDEEITSDSESWQISDSTDNDCDSDELDVTEDDDECDLIIGCRDQSETVSETGSTSEGVLPVIVVNSEDKL